MDNIDQRDHVWSVGRALEWIEMWINTKVNKNIINAKNLFYKFHLMYDLKRKSSCFCVEDDSYEFQSGTRYAIDCNLLIAG